MRRGMTSLLVAPLLLGFGLAGAASGEAGKSPDWAINATVIEACSCPMFCQCFFNSQPAAHGHAGHGEGTHFCKFNNAYKINKGQYGSVQLDGVKFWLAGDLGDEDFSKAKGQWSVLTVDQAASKEQREAVAVIMRHIIPFEWGSFKTAEGAIDWAADGDMARATIDGGKTAEVRLKRFQGMTDEPVVIRNLKYWGASKNDAFVLMPNEVEAYRVGDKAFEFKGTTGFMVTFDLTSKDVGAASAH